MTAAQLATAAASLADLNSLAPRLCPVCDQPVTSPTRRFCSSRCAGKSGGQAAAKRAAEKKAGTK